MCKVNVFLSNIFYSCNRKFFHRNIDSISKFNEQDKFMAGITSINVKSRVCFGISVLLSKFQSRIKLKVFVLHLRKYVVAGSVHNPRKRDYFVAGKAFLNGFHNRNSTANCRLETNFYVLFFSNLKNFFSSFGKKGFIG